jgi:hypothetical protein
MQDGTLSDRCKRPSEQSRERVKSDRGAAPASSTRPNTVAAILAAVVSSRSKSSVNGQEILSLHTTEPFSVSTSVRAIRT